MYEKRILIFVLVGIFFLSLGTGLLKYNVYVGGWEGLQTDLSQATIYYDGQYIPYSNLYIYQRSGTAFKWDLNIPEIQDAAHPTMMVTVSNPTHTTAIGVPSKASDPDQYVKKYILNVSRTEEVWVDPITGESKTTITWTERTFYLRYFYLQAKMMTTVEPIYYNEKLYVHLAMKEDWIFFGDHQDIRDENHHYQFWMDPSESDGLDQMCFTDITMRIPISVDHWQYVHPNDWSGIMSAISLHSEAKFVGTPGWDDPGVFSTTAYTEVNWFTSGDSVPVPMFLDDGSPFTEVHAIGNTNNPDTLGVDPNIPNKIWIELGFDNVQPGLALDYETFDTHGKQWFMEAVAADRNHNGIWDTDDVEVANFLAPGSHTYDFPYKHSFVDCMVTWDLLFEILQTQDRVYTTTIVTGAAEVGKDAKYSKIAAWLQENPWINWAIILLVIGIVVALIYQHKKTKGKERSGISILSKFKYMIFGGILLILLLIWLLFGWLIRWLFTIFNTFETTSFNVFSTFSGLEDPGGASAITLSSQTSYLILGITSFAIAGIFYYLKMKDPERKEEIATIIVHGGIFIAGFITLVTNLYIGLGIIIVSSIGLLIWICLTRRTNEEIRNTTLSLYFTVSLLVEVVLSIVLFCNFYTYGVRLIVLYFGVSTLIFLDALIRLLQELNITEVNPIFYDFQSKYKLLVIGVLGILTYLWLSRIFPISMVEWFAITSDFIIIGLFLTSLLLLVSDQISIKIKGWLG